MALREFISKEGKPDQIMSDKECHFKATAGTTEAALQDIIEDPAVNSYVSGQRIKWSFIIKLTPWIELEGFYETFVGVTKTILKKSIGKQGMTDIQIQTMLAEIEAALSSRLLIYLNDDINDQVIITHAQFL